jgi:hypothetical protein
LEAAAAKDAKSTKKDAERCENINTDNGPDICAQWVAANAARDGAKVSRETLYWNIAAFFAILFTLIATAWAAFAASAAAKAANLSLDLFQAAESGQLIPKIRQTDYTTVTVTLHNTGRTAVTIIHADMCGTSKPNDKPLPTFFNEHGTFQADVLIAPEEKYTFSGGPMQIPHEHPECWFYGGAIYRTIFGKLLFVPISVLLDRTTGETRVVHDSDFSRWEDFTDRLQRTMKQRK